MNRRSILTGVVTAGAFGGCVTSQSEPSSRAESPSCEVACFEFSHQGFDDAPDWVTITHSEGRNLSAEEVFITNVIVGQNEDRNWVQESQWDNGTVAWHEVDDETDPTDDISGESIRVDIEFPDVVRVLWRHEGDEQVLDETADFR